MIQVLINSTDRTSLIATSSLEVEQAIGNQVDTAHFTYRKYGSRTWIPAVNNTIEIFDGATKIFGGRILTITERVVNRAEGIEYEVECVDHTYELDSLLVSKTYTSQTITQIITDLKNSYAPSFTVNNVTSSFNVGKIVFNQIPMSQCLKRLADIVKYDWYVDPNKDINFFSKYTQTAPFNVTDTSGNYVHETLERKMDGSQLANQVKVRGGEYDAATYTDIITVKGNDQKSFKLPYKFSNLTVEKDAGAGFVSQTVGVDFTDTFLTKQVLHNYQERTIKFENALTDGNRIRFSGNPKVRVLAIAADADSIALYSTKEKIIRDNSIEDLDTARRRAIAELAAYKDQMNRGSFSTYIAGLHVGQVINLSSVKRNNANVDFLITRVRFYAKTHDTFQYDVELVTTRTYDLQDLLSRILQPEDLQGADAETNEIIKTDLATVMVMETITRGTSRTDIRSITVVENIQKDPLGANTEPDWVLADYFPTSPADTKREGVLDYSLKVY